MSVYYTDGRKGLTFIPNESSLAHGIVLCAQEEADQYLMHYRIGGEKKGVRRWQDKSGSLTPEGYKHYAEMYGWNKKVQKAENLQNKADKKSEAAQNAARRSEEAAVKAYNAKQKNERRPSDRRQAKFDKLNAESEKRKVAASQANLDAMKAQKKAVDYADKLQRKEDKMSKYVDENGKLTEEAINKYTYATPNPGEKKMSLLGRIKFGNEYSNKFNDENKMKMTKEEYKDWEKSEKQKFQEESKAEQETFNLSRKIDKYDKLSDADKAETLHKVEDRLEELSKKEKGEGLTPYERKMQDGLNDWLQQTKEKISKNAFNNLMSMSKEELDSVEKKNELFDLGGDLLYKTHSGYDKLSNKEKQQLEKDVFKFVANEDADERERKDLTEWLEKNRDLAGTEFNGNSDHDDVLRSTSTEAIKDRIKQSSDYFKNAYDSENDRTASLKYLTQNEGKLHPDALKNVGDDLLSYLEETGNEYSKLFNPGGKWDGKAYREAANDLKYQDFRDLSDWMVKQVYDKSGSWNSGDFKPNSNGKKAYDAYDAACDALWKREEEVKKEQKISGDIGSYSYSSKNEKEYQKLQKALKNDSVWQKLNKAVTKADKDLCGAILKDLGFRDTPENRYLIAQWAFID